MNSCDIRIPGRMTPVIDNSSPEYHEYGKSLHFTDVRPQAHLFGWLRTLIKLLTLLCIGCFYQAGVWAEGLPEAKPVLEEIEVTGKWEKPFYYREYNSRDGKRYVKGPHGDVESIRTVAAGIRRIGQHKRISTRGLTMPHSYTGSVINRYDYPLPEECGGGLFSYYEGDGFTALGYRTGEITVLDTLSGGGPFSAPQLWGPYDQVLGDRENVSMKPVAGDGEQDGMGVLKAAYAIGMMPVMSTRKFNEYAQIYVVAVGRAVECFNTSLVGNGGGMRQVQSNW